MSVSVTFTVAGPDAQKFKDILQSRATADGMSMSEWITQALADYLRRQNGK